MGDRISMSISGDSLSDETLNRGPLALHLWRQYEFPFEINIVQFSIFSIFQFSIHILYHISLSNIDNVFDNRNGSKRTFQILELEPIRRSRTSLILTFLSFFLV